MADINRRRVLQLLASAPVAAGFAWTDAEAIEAHRLAQAARDTAQAGTAFTPKFFTPHEYETVRVLVDLIIPRDERSGSATEAGVPEFMDFILADQPARQTAMRGGLAWLDVECQKRFDKTFLNCGGPERAAVLDDIAWPQRVKPPLSHGAAFFSSFRDLTATGFWTTKMGVEDLQYLGNKYVPRWTGCPDDALKQLGVRYPSE
jgi:gluconate 2-dehydrogenase gamma chain